MLDNPIMYNPSSPKIPQQQQQILNLINQGNLLENRGKLDEAMDCYRQAVNLAPNHTQANQKLAEALKKQGKLTEAVFYYQQAVAPNTLSSHTDQNEEISIKQNMGEHQMNVTKIVNEEQFSQQAQLSYEQKNWQEAINLCQQALQINPSLAQAYKIWGNALQQLGQHDQALALYSKALTINPDFAEVYANVGSIYARQKNWQQALSYYQKAVNINPNLAAVYRNIAKIFREVGQNEQATQATYQALNIEPEKATFQEYYTIGNELLQQGQTSQAINCFRRAIENNPNYIQAYQQLAEIAQQQGEWQEAGSYYRKIIELQSQGVNNPVQQQLKTSPETLPDQIKGNISQLNIEKTPPNLDVVKPQSTPANIPSLSESNSAESFANLGSMYAQKKQWQEAISAYQKALKINPKFAGVYRNLARIYSQIEQEESSAQYWYQAYKLEPNANVLENYHNLGQLFAEKGKITEAFNCYQNLIQLKPDFSPAYHGMGKILVQQGKEDEAKHCYEEAIKQNPQDGESYILLAEILGKEGNWQEAIACYLHVCQLNPNNWQAYHHLGDIYLKEEQDWEKAVNYYLQAIQINPAFSWSYHNLGEAYLKLKLWQKAKEALQKAIEINPNFHWSYYNLAEALVKLEEWEEAADSYNQAMGIKGDLPNIEQKIDYVLQQQVHSDLEAAFKSYLEAIQENPNDVETYYQALEIKPENWELQIGLGNALLANQRLEEAIVCWEKIISINPNFSKGYLNLAKALQQQGKQQEAQTYYHQALKIDSNSITDEEKQIFSTNFLDRETSLLEEKKWQEAEELYRQLIMSNPNSCEAYYNLGLTLLNQKKLDEAATYFDQAIEKNDKLSEAYYKLGEIFTQQEKWEKVYDCYQKIDSLDESFWENNFVDWKIQDRLADVLFQQEQWQQASNILVRLVKFNSEVSKYTCNLGVALGNLGYLEKSIDYLKQTIKNVPNSAYAHYELARVLVKTKAYEEAVKAYKTAFILQPSTPYIQDICKLIYQAIKAEIDSSLVLPLYQIYQSVCNNLNLPKIILEKSFWLNSSMVYLEGKILDYWLLGKKQVLATSEDQFIIGNANFFQIDHEQVAGFVVFERAVYRQIFEFFKFNCFDTNTPVLFEGSSTEKAYNLQFINYLNKKPDYQIHLVRENINLTLRNFINPQQKKDASELSRKLDYFLQVKLLGFAESQCPFKIHFDHIIPINNDSFLLIGWMHDPYNSLEKIELISSLGFTLKIYPKQIYSLERNDVSKHLENTAYGNFHRKLGFCSYIEVPLEITQTYSEFAQMHNCRFKIYLQGGIEIEIVPSIKYQDIDAARKLVLTPITFTSAPIIADEIIENCILPAASKLQKLCMKEVKIEEVKIIGKLIENPLISIIIPLYKQLEFIKIQFATFANDPAIKKKCELIYVLDSPELEKGVKDLLFAYSSLYEIPVKLVIMQRNSGYASANNAGAANGNGKYLILLNSDVFLKTKGWAVKMADFYEQNPKIGTLAPKLLYEDESVQHAGMYFAKTKFPFWQNLHYFKGFSRNYGEVKKTRCVPAVTGACLMIKKDLYHQVGGLSTEYIIGDFEDSDLCLKCADLGYENWYYADAELYHLERQSVPLSNIYSGSLAWQCNARIHANKWKKLITQVMSKYHQ